MVRDGRLSTDALRANLDQLTPDQHGFWSREIRAQMLPRRRDRKPSCLVLRLIRRNPVADLREKRVERALASCHLQRLLGRALDTN